MRANAPDESLSAIERVRRWRGRIGLAWLWVRSRALELAPKRTWMSVAGVGMAIALLVCVTGLAVGMASPVTGTGEADEYWIVPASGGDSSPLVAAGEPQFGNVHAANDRLLEYDGVESSTPLLMEVVRLESEGSAEYVVAIGVVPDSSGGSVAGLSTAAMTAGDPYHGSESDEAVTGEVVLSEGAASLLEADDGTELSVAGGGTTRSVTVVDVDEGDGGVLGTTPIAVMQLSELQAISGATDYDRADQFLVRLDGSADATALEGLYDESEVRSSSEMTTQQVLDAELPLALGLTAVLVSIIVGTLFITTTMVLEVTGSRSQLTTLHAMGIGLRSQLSLYALQTLIVTSLGGLLGGAVGLLGIELLNVAATRLSSIGTVAVGQPSFLLYGLGVSLVIGLVTIPLLGIALWKLDIGGERIRE